MAEGEKATLTDEQRRALLVLGYLFLRMGHFERAKKLYAALLALNPDDNWAHRSMAAALVALGDGSGALTHIDKALGTAPLSSRDNALYLLKARALWRTGRSDEAKNAVNAWIAAGGSRQ